MTKEKTAIRKKPFGCPKKANITLDGPTYDKLRDIQDKLGDIFGRAPNITNTVHYLVTNWRFEDEPASVKTESPQPKATEMTIRQHIATQAMIALIPTHTPAGAAQEAVEYTDDLLAELGE